MRPFFIQIFSFLLLWPLTITAEEILENSDSIKKVLEAQIDTSKFEDKNEVLSFLQLTSKLNLNNPTEALYYTRTLENKQAISNNKVGKAYIHSYKANYYWAQGIYDAALKDYFLALSLFEESDNEFEMAKQLNNIGETYKKRNNYKKSAIFLKQALSLANTIDGLNPELILVNLGQLYMLQSRYDSALYYLDDILTNKDLKDENALGFAHLYKGIIYRGQAIYDSASYHFHKSMAIWEKSSFLRSIVETNTEMAKLAMMENHLKLADQILHKAEEEAISINALDLLMRIYRYQIDLSKEFKGKDSIIYFYDKYISIKDSIFNEETRSEINKLSIQYELSQKEKDYYKLALEQNILTNEVKTQNRFLIFLSLVIVFAAIFIFMLWKQRNNLIKAQKQLRLQKESIENQQHEISKKSLELASLNKELYALNQTLEEKIIERGNQLNLRNKQIAQYTYFNSHKLRAPVASVLGLINVLELSKNGQLDHQILEYLKVSANELDLIIHNLKNILEAEIDDFNNED